jgi:hypothetical protein
MAVLVMVLLVSRLAVTRSGGSKEPGLVPGIDL